MNYFNQSSERLIYRKLSEADLESWTAFFINNDSLRFLGIKDLSMRPEDLAHDWIFNQFKRYRESGLGHLAVVQKEGQQFIGVGGIIPRIVDDKNVFEISYSLKQEFWGKGYGTELAKQLKQFGLTNKISNAFVSIIHVENTPSINVAIKNGMKKLWETHYLGMDVFVYGDKP